MSIPSAPSPALFFDTINAYQKSAALKAAIDLDLFTAIGDAPRAAAEIAAACQASERGVRILCDYLVIHGFLTKAGETYSLTQDSAIFLSKKSPAYAGGAVEFFLAPKLVRHFENLAESVRKGGAALEEATTSPENAVWINFARSMGPLMAPSAAALAEMLPLPDIRPSRILDISASHGYWGISVARKNPQSQLTALDWESVLAVSRENALAAGLGERFSVIAGDAFAVDFGADYDVVLAPNFLHHFDFATCVRFLKKVHAALLPGGRVAIVEFVPNPDRITPPMSAAFCLVMLSTTPAGDAYTYAELASMLSEAGFRHPEQQPLPSGAAAVFGTK